MNKSFNQSISNWDVSNVYLWLRCSTKCNFILNLTGWCVSNFGSEPTSFATNSALTNSNKPIWGKEFTISYYQWISITDGNGNKRYEIFNIQLLNL